MTNVPVLLTPRSKYDVTYVDKANPQMCVWSDDIIKVQNFFDIEGNMVSRVQLNIRNLTEDVTTMDIAESPQEVCEMILRALKETK